MNSVVALTLEAYTQLWEVCRYEFIVYSTYTEVYSALMYANLILLKNFQIVMTIKLNLKINTKFYSVPTLKKRIDDKIER